MCTHCWWCVSPSFRKSLLLYYQENLDLRVMVWFDKKNAVKVKRQICPVIHLFMSRDHLSWSYLFFFAVLVLKEISTWNLSLLWYQENLDLRVIIWFDMKNAVKCQNCHFIHLLMNAAPVGQISNLDVYSLLVMRFAISVIQDGRHERFSKLNKNRHFSYCSLIHETHKTMKYEN